MKAKSIRGKCTGEISEALSIAISSSFAPTVAIAFVSIKQNRKAIVQMLTDKNIDVFGATSSGEFINDYQSEGEAVILLLEMDRTHYRILWEEVGERKVQDAAVSIATSARQAFPNLALIVCSTGMTANAEFFDGETMVKTIEDNIGADKIFFGGMAGDDMSFTGTYVFTHDKETDAGIIALALDADKIALSGMAVTGWQPMGIARTVTKSKENRLYSIDGKPAVEMYLKYLGKEDKQTDVDFNVFEELGYTFPFITERETGGDTVLRSPLKVDHSENALLLDVGMPEGTRFWFSMPPDFEIVDEILDEARQLKKSNAMEADALLIFSCAGRPPVLGPLVTAENDGLAEIWKVPMARFFTYGEYGRTKNGKQEFHSGACCWVAIKEK